jgi:hypothetical protein
MPTQRKRRTTQILNQKRTNAMVIPVHQKPNSDHSTLQSKFEDELEFEFDFLRLWRRKPMEQREENFRRRLHNG